MRAILHATVIAALVLMVVTTSTSAHMLSAIGSLSQLFAQADWIAIGRIEASPSGADAGRLRLKVDKALFATVPPEAIEIRCPLRVEIGKRYVFAMQRSEAGNQCLHKPGVVLPCANGGDDDGYLGIAAASRITGDDGVALRAALITALASRVSELVHHAALELYGATHGEHRLSEAERQRLRAVITAAGFEPTLRTLLEPLTIP